MPIDVSQAMRSAVPPTYASFAFVINPWPHLSASSKLANLTGGLQDGGFRRH